MGCPHVPKEIHALSTRSPAPRIGRIYPQISRKTHFFEHPQGGKLKLWIEPAGADSAGKLFESRFNLLLGAP